MQLELIWATARYEMLTLLRGWFFRIFAGASLALFITIDIIFFSTAVDVPRFFNGLSCSAPYANMMMLNMAQVVVIIMLATDFFKRDKKMNTTEVFYIRSMTNFSYLLGKLLGIFLIFAGLDILLLAIAALIQLVFSNITFNWVTYILYPAVMILPVFIFITGLSFLLMNLIKNQAIVVLILLGYCAAEMFYLRDKLFFLYDFLAMNLPLAYSDFIGFDNTTLIFWQRSFYFCLGIAMMLISSLLFTRLPQSVFLKRLSVLVSALLLMLSIYFVYNYVYFYEDLFDRRTAMNRLNESFMNEISVEPLAYDIDLQHSGYEIGTTTRIRFKNSADSDLEQIIFCINPGQSVSQVRYNEKDIEFEQSLHIIRISLPQALKRLTTDSLEISCSGNIDPAVCYPDIKDDQFTGRFSFWLYQVHKNYASLTPGYVLLSPESLWYPQPGLPRGSESLKKDHKRFCSFRLHVSTTPQLTAISQGNPLEAAGGEFVFRTDKPLPGLSVAIGNYKKESVTVDSVEYTLYRHPAHNYYEDYFSGITDTLHHLIREVQQEYTVRLNLDYPYKRLYLVEVPIQFYSHPRIWTVARETVQPEQIWFPENAAYINSADFNRLKESMDRRLDRSNQTMTEIETQATMFKNFIRYTFHGQAARFMRGSPPVTYNPDFNLFPNYYTFVNNFRTNGQPILNAAVEAYLYNKVKEKDESFSFVRTEGLTDEEKVSRLLADKSLAELVDASDRDDLLSAVIKIKGAYLLKMIQSDVGTDRLDRMITDIIQRNRFMEFDFNEFIDILYQQQNFNLISYLDDWLNKTELPGFLTSGIRMFKILDEDRIRHQILFKIQNTESVSAVFEVTFQYGGGGRRMMVDQPEAKDPGRVFHINEHETREIGIVLDSEPRSMNIDFIIAKNIPLVYSEQFEKAELNKRFQPVDGEKPAEALNRLISDTEVIVDNEDETFSVDNPPYQSLIKRWIITEEKEEEFDRFRWWNPPQRWRLLKNTTFFGRYIHSAYYIRPGDGSRSAIWKAVLPREGLYNIFTYMFRKEDLWRSRRSSQISYGDYKYVIHHSAGEDEVTIDVDKAAPGWNYLGTYFFPGDSAQVVLSNESNGRVIIADAVKWVKN